MRCPDSITTPVPQLAIQVLYSVVITPQYLKERIKISEEIEGVCKFWRNEFWCAKDFVTR